VVHARLSVYPKLQLDKIGFFWSFSMFSKVGARWVLGIASAVSMFGVGTAAHAEAIPIVGNSVFVSAANPNGTSFTYEGTIKSGDTMSFEVTGESLLQADQYGTNAAGIVQTAGYFPGEDVGSAKLVKGSTLTLGALVMEVNGFGPVVFKPDAGNGLGSSTPPGTLVFTGTLSKIFGNFTPINDPTFTLLVADESNMYFDNSGGFTVTQIPSSVPVPAAAWQSLAGVAGVALLAGRKKLAAAMSIAR
jgi:hypothetical protein